MKKHIGKTLRILRGAAALSLLAWAFPCAALAFKSAYTSISLPGEFDSGPSWDTGTHKLELVADYVWQGVLDVTKSGQFKFAANGGWDVNWGVFQTVAEVPAQDVGPMQQGGSNISLSVPAGKYRFVFFEDTKTFSVLPLDVPSYDSVQLVGNFNDQGAQDTGTMASQGNGVWTATVDLAYGSTFRVKAGETILGAHSSAMASLGEMPNRVALYGSAESVMECQGGTFEFTADFRSNLLSVVQTATNAFTLACVGADGNFACGSKTPGQNLEDVGDNVWQGSFMVDKDSFTLRFIGRDKNDAVGRWWGFPAGTVITELPASGTLEASDSTTAATAATFNTGAGDYVFRINPYSGSYTVRRHDRANMLQNPSFETQNDDGSLPGWGLYHAAAAASSAYDAHSGTNSAILQRLYDDWDNLGNIDQRIQLKNYEGIPFEVSASFRCGGASWNGDTVRIIVEWLDSSGAMINEESVEILNLDRHWQTATLSTTVPASNVTAHVLFKYDGAVLGESVLIDDIFAGIATSREQNFDAWGRHDNFGPIDPDWSVDSGKTILNSSERILGGLVISRYIESTGNTKAIELYNGTASNINFKSTPYVLQQYDNGSTTPTVNIHLTNGTIPAGRTFAITRTFTATNYPPDSAFRQFGAISGISNRILRTDALTFNGDDVIVLRKGSASGRVVDRVGQVSPTASGSLWSRMATDHTLVRNASVTNGTASNPTNAFDLSQWTVLENGDFGDLGSHAFVDPDAPFVPTGYSLLLDTDATLVTPALDGGIGDISFVARAQGFPTGSDLTLAVESAADAFSDIWTTEAVVKIPLSQTNFARFECVAANPANTVVRFRSIGDGTTNRIRLDDISIGRAYTVKRTENFAAWTGEGYAKDGTYTIAQWTLCGHVAANGISSTLAGNLPVDTGWVRSPTFSGGVGQVAFALCRATTNDSVQATLQVSADDGITWTDVQTFTYGTGTKTFTNVSAWVYVPSNGCARIVCDGGTAPAIVDNISVGIPSVSRTLDFNDFSPSSNYKSYGYKGWNLTGLAIVTSNAWSGNSGLLQNGTLSSPYIDNIGSVSFVYRMGPYSGDNTAKLKIEASTNGTSWTIITNGLLGGAEWQTYGYWFDEGADWHYIRISQTTSGKRMLLDDIALNAPTPLPTVTLSSSLNPTYPSIKEVFQLAATAYPRNGAEILSVTGFVKYTKSGRFTALPMEDAGAGDYLSAVQPGRNGGESIISYASVWYGGVGVVPGNPGYAVTNLSTPVTTVTVSSVRSGEVWINEIFYERSVDDWLTDDWGFEMNQDHEFVEICGKAGTDIGNWKIQLAYALSADIAAYSNQAIYATYVIPAGTKIPDTGNGYGFWLLADTGIEGANQTLAVYDPLDADWSDVIRSHIRDAAGVVRLVNQYGGVMHSISYGTYADSSEKLPVSQSTAIDNEYAPALSGAGGLYSDFAWTTQKPTPGTVNGDQTLDGTITVNLMPIWHDPTVCVTTTLRGTFFLLDPEGASQSEAVRIFYAYPQNDFPSYISLGGTLHHRLQGAGTWATVEKNNDFSGNDNPTNNEAYFSFQPIPAYSYKRLQTIEYVIEASAPGYATTYLGTEDGTTSVAYETLLEAQSNPFTHYYPLADPIVITNYSLDFDANTIRLDTDGNDSQDRLTEFKIRSTTDLRLPTEEWDEITDFEHDGALEWDTFLFDLPDGPARHFAVQPVR